ncbi:MAG: hypothetical protein J7501_10555 [Bdellovibrio sp.]|nr:hypothetical protein [Bdellovibrio sp.]
MRSRWSLAFAILWAVSAVAIIFLLTATNLFMPVPTDPWIITHVLAPEEKNSEELVHELLARKPIDHIHELIILIDAHASLSRSLKERGYSVYLTKSADILTANLGLTPPFFLLTSPRNEGAFAGPYRKVSEAIHALEMMQGRASWLNLSGLGCGTGARVRNLIDSKALVNNNVGP